MSIQVIVSQAGHRKPDPASSPQKRAPERWRHWIAAFLPFLLLLVLTLPGWAQQATIQGVVQDPSGAVIPTANVAATNLQTQTHVSTQTNESGFYSLIGLVPGLYRVDVDVTGFTPGRQTNLKLDVNQVARVDFTLKVGTMTEAVEVSAAPSALNTDSSVVGQLVDNRSVVELPLNGRNYLQLAQLSVGTTSDFGSRTSSTGTFSAVGQSAWQVSIQLDGIDNSSRASGGELGYQAQAVTPSVDAVQEFKVVTNNNSAEYGRRMGGTVIVQTKSGTNEYHGTAYEFLRNQVLDATNFFNVGKPKPVYRQNQFGGTLGGPIQRNKLFFFASAEGTRFSQDQFNTSTVPTLDERNGVFSQQRTIYDPATTAQNANGVWTRATFAGNQIPLDRFDAVASKAMALYPQPNMTGIVGSSGVVNNYYYAGAQANRTNQYDGRLDYDLTPMQRFFVRYSRRDYNSDTPGIMPLPADGGASQSVDWTSNSVVANWNAVLSSSANNELRLGYSRTDSVIDIPWTENYSQILGIQGLVDLGESSERGMPLLSPSGYNSLGPTNFWPNHNNLGIIQINDSFTKIIGTHSIKAGIDLMREYNFRLAARYDRGAISFGGAFTQDPNNRALSGDGLADFLLGTASGGTYGNQQGESMLTHNYAVFVEDTWRATSKLTLNLGLRWDRLGFPSFHSIPVSNLLFSYDSQTPRVTTPTDDSDCGCINNNRNFSPRIGLAYAPFKDWIFHSGFGVYYGASNVADQDGARFASQPPEWTEYSFSTDRLVSPALTLATGFPAGLFPATTIRQNVNVNTAQPWMPNQYSMEWFSDVQHSLPSDVVVTASYIGVGSRQLPYNMNYNTPFTPGAAAIQTRRPWPYYGTIQAYPAGANSSYDALALKAEKRYSHSLTTLVSYTWSHNIATGTGLLSDSSQSVRNPYNLSLDRGNAAYDIRHSLVASFVYDLPLGRDRKWLHTPGPVDWMLGGWQVSGIFTARSGRYFSPTVGTDLLNTGTTNYPNRIGDGNLSSDKRSIAHWFDSSAFTVPASYVYGNSGRNILEGPGAVNMDMNLSKNFQFRERYRLQFRAEAFNLTNTPAFGLPNTNLQSSAVGQITTAGAARILQGALKLMF
jgi:hypothetical protein